LDGEDVECPAHGSRFNVRTGEVSGLPAEDPVDTYPVTIEGDEIFVEV
jgi:3-phenylpropionate/trans-cinnamate dioxygenase ferredoxin component